MVTEIEYVMKYMYLYVNYCQYFNLNQTIKDFTGILKLSS